MKYGYEYQADHFKDWDEERRKDFCEECYDGSHFPASSCARCALFKREPGFLFCTECCHSDGFGGCSRSPGSWCGAGWGCTKGHPRIGT